MLPHRPGVRLFGVDAFAGHVVAYEWADALPTLRVIRSDGTQFVIDQPEAAFALSRGTNLEYETSTYRFNYQSLITPPSVFDVDLVTGELDSPEATARARRVRPGRVRDRPSLGRRRPTAPRCRSHSSRRRAYPATARNPAVLYGYGSYESIVAPVVLVAAASACSTGAWCSPSRTSAAGASSAGAGTSTASCCTSATRSPTSWPCAEHLVAEGWTSADRLAIRGGSAGGLLVGAAVNLRPDLFASVVAEVPFVDVVNSMLDEILPLTVSEWEEWGNPNERRVRGVHVVVRAVRERRRRRRTRRSSRPRASTTPA